MRIVTGESLPSRGDGCEGGFGWGYNKHGGGGMSRFYVGQGSGYGFGFEFGNSVGGSFSSYWPIGANPIRGDLQ
jgi:hypothetical protein